jgi:perosamine synthetase
MTAPAPESAVPREQFPSWQYFSVLHRREEPAHAAPRDAISFFWARNAIYHALHALAISPGAHVLLPAYLCRAAVEPFEFFGANVEFYSIGRICEPDFSEIEAKITPRTEAILAAHYFGFPQRIDAFRAICDRHRIALIEDCAHVLRGSFQGRPLGSFGDASVFSWRKFLPIYDGGELWLNHPRRPLVPGWRKETFPFTLKVAKSLFDKTLENSTSFLAKSLSLSFESLKSAAKRLRRSSAPDAPLFALDSNRATFDDSLLNQRMSRVSRWLRAHCDLPAIRENRRHNFQFLLAELRNLPGITLLHHELPDSVCPWIFPIFFNNVPDAHLLLQSEGIPAVNWVGVRPPALNPKAFPDADFLYDNLIFLPVHQNISAAGLESIVRAVKKISASGAAQPQQVEFARSSKIA